ncbi:MAG: EAL domain-containing protein [Planctomycetota bacterium]
MRAGKRLGHQSIIDLDAGVSSASVPGRLRFIYIAALSLVAMMTVTSHVILDRTIVSRASDGAVINVAGKQRTLSQKIAKLALEVPKPSTTYANPTDGTLSGPDYVARARVRLEATHAEWAAAHTALQNGDASMGIPLLEHADIRSKFAELKLHFEAIDAGVQRLLRGNPAQHEDALATILAHEDEFLRQQDLIVDAFEQHAAEQIAGLSSVSRGLLAVTLVLLVIEALFVFEPARRLIQRQLRTLADINDRMSLEARHDGLTGLPNRKSLMEDLAGLCRSRADGDKSREFAVCFVDFDRFKAINDSLGHDAGDELLCNIATRIEELKQHATPLTLDGYRLGGDEYVLLLVGPDAAAQVERITTLGVEIFARPHRLMNQDCVSTASIGVVTSHEFAPTPELLLRDADLAMIRAKERGKSQVVLFDQSMYEHVKRRQHIERELRDALAQDTLAIRYQPIYQADSLELEAVEALLYWKHPTLGRVANDELIDIAEETGLIHSLGNWVVNTVARDVTSREDAWLHDARFAGSRVHVNVSHAEIMHPGFVQRFERILSDYPAMRNRLCLECPASVLGRGGEAFQLVIDRLHQNGVLFALDHLDREQVSLTQLATLPLDALKVGVPDSLSGGDLATQKYAAVLQAITLFAQHRNIRVIGTGVEKDDQIAAATASNVSSLQGNLLREVATLNVLMNQPMPDTLANALDGILSQMPGLAA